VSFVLTVRGVIVKLIKKFFRVRKNSHGQSIVEITLITPLLLVALYIPADFGIAFFVANITATAARDGARLGSASGKSGGTSTNRDFAAADAATVRDAVVAKLPAYLTSRSVTVKFYEDTPANCLEVIEVNASGNYNFFFYQLLRLFGGTAPNTRVISRTAQMPYRYQPSTNNTICTGTTVNVTYSNV
jgi:Flp pilus assembly protein TadG